MGVVSFERTALGSTVRTVAAAVLLWKLKNYVQRWSRPSNVNGKVILITGGG